MEALLQNRVCSNPKTSVIGELSSWPPRRASLGVGFVDDFKGEVDGLMSCTESLGFESCDERTSAAIEQLNTSDSWRQTAKAKRVEERRKIREFPPPLSTLSDDGHRSFILRAVRTRGRLELREVSIDKPEIFKSCREDGRLKLRLASDENGNLEPDYENDESDVDRVQFQEDNREDVVSLRCRHGTHGLQAWSRQCVATGRNRPFL